MYLYEYAPKQCLVIDRDRAQPIAWPAPEFVYTPPMSDASRRQGQVSATSTRSRSRPARRYGSGRRAWRTTRRSSQLEAGCVQNHGILDRLLCAHIDADKRHKFWAYRLLRIIRPAARSPIGQWAAIWLHRRPGGGYEKKKRETRMSLQPLGRLASGNKHTVFALPQ